MGGGGDVELQRRDLAVGPDTNALRGNNPTSTCADRSPPSRSGTSELRRVRAAQHGRTRLRHRAVRLPSRAESPFGRPPTWGRLRRRTRSRISSAANSAWVAARPPVVTMRRRSRPGARSCRLCTPSSTPRRQPLTRSMSRGRRWRLAQAVNVTVVGCPRGTRWSWRRAAWRTAAHRRAPCPSRRRAGRAIRVRCRACECEGERASLLMSITGGNGTGEVRGRGVLAGGVAGHQRRAAQQPAHAGAARPLRRRVPGPRRAGRWVVPADDGGVCERDRHAGARLVRAAGHLGRQ